MLSEFAWTGRLSQCKVHSFFFKWRSKLAKKLTLRNCRLVFLVVFFFANRYKELAENHFQLLSQFVCLSCLAFQKKEIRATEQQRFCSSFFLVFSFSCPSMNSSIDESRLWKWLVWFEFEAIFLKKNAPKLLEMCYLSVRQEER